MSGQGIKLRNIAPKQIVDMCRRAFLFPGSKGATHSAGQAPSVRSDLGPRAKGYRFPAPGSQPPAKVPRESEEMIYSTNYYTRDTRRHREVVVVMKHPTLLGPDEEADGSFTAVQEQIEALKKKLGANSGKLSAEDAVKQIEASGSEVTKELEAELKSLSNEARKDKVLDIALANAFNTAFQSTVPLLGSPGRKNPAVERYDPSGTRSAMTTTWSATDEMIEAHLPTHLPTPIWMRSQMDLVKHAVLNDIPPAPGRQHQWQEIPAVRHEYRW